MLRTFDFAQNKIYDASGIENPNDWLRELHHNINVYYPVKQINKSEQKPIAVIQQPIN